LRSEIASYLPAVFIFSSCRTRGDATRNGGVPWLSSYRIAGILPAVFLIGSLASCRLSFLSDRWHPAGNLSYRIAGTLPAIFLIGSLASCRLFF
jgi:hypothetical protein